jgi:hypothetical protein
MPPLPRREQAANYCGVLPGLPVQRRPVRAEDIDQPEHAIAARHRNLMRGYGAARRTSGRGGAPAGQDRTSAAVGRIYIQTANGSLRRRSVSTRRPTAPPELGSSALPSHEGPEKPILDRRLIDCHPSISTGWTSSTSMLAIQADDANGRSCTIPRVSRVFP